jgi:hypothetical protein
MTNSHSACLSQTQRYKLTRIECRSHTRERSNHTRECSNHSENLRVESTRKSRHISLLKNLTRQRVIMTRLCMKFTRIRVDFQIYIY